jgi:hypothetical protein
MGKLCLTWQQKVNNVVVLQTIWGAYK